MARCDAFLRDIDIAEKSMVALSGTEEWTPRFGLEIYTYYLVGFVTCLEWHARSRLVDLFNHMPECVLAEDLKGHVNDRVLSQMAAAKVGVPEMLGAILTVGSVEAYLSTILRVFKALAIPKNEAELLAELRAQFDLEPHAALADLFERRHRLIHEISLGELGSWVIRANINLEEARRIGRLVYALLRMVEREITAHAPAGFPNKLDTDGFPENISERLDHEILQLETTIADAIRNNPDVAGIAATPELWEARKAASTASSAADTEFIEACRFAGQRHIDHRGPLLISLKEGRLQFLKEIADNFPPEHLSQNATLTRS
jgi:hypothetical protein